MTSYSAYHFDAQDADIILVSSEEECPAEFRVHRCILAAASSFFSDMFSLPQSPNAEKIPRIIVSEPRSTLDTLLRFVYPIPDPTSRPSTSSSSSLVLHPNMISALSLRFSENSSFPHFLISSPTRVYAIACRYDLEFESKIASTYTLNVNILDAPLSEDLKYITAFSYHRLLDLHRKRAQAAQALLKIPENVKCMQCNGNTLAVFGQPKWWIEFERMAKEELAARPTTDVIFGMDFLAKSTYGVGCQRCPASVLDSWRFLQELKASIDALPQQYNPFPPMDS
ncbi:hypothetical protein BD779DRAFT_656685 [Infundibulicybe gibba]|nr:hypothetical protein BD779DRAFT_656685 [Infundibulicybe gibba]